MAQYTISHSEYVKGWTSFWSYIPDWMARMDDQFYSFKNGQLWMHNDTDNLLRNNFYGEQQASSVKTVINEAMEDDKVFKTLVTESDQKWAASIITNYTAGQLQANEFTTHESRQFTFLRQNEDDTDTGGHAVQGIGVIQQVSGLNITYRQLPNMVNITDRLYQINSDTQELIGEITAINRQTKTITVASITVTPVVGRYTYARKNSRADGAEIRGRYMEVLLSNSDPIPGELMAVGTNAVKSYI